jgi:hypothetical protein
MKSQSIEGGFFARGGIMLGTGHVIGMEISEKYYFNRELVLQIRELS